MGKSQNLVLNQEEEGEWIVIMDRMIETIIVVITTISNIIIQNMEWATMERNTKIT